jgi:hypothetical protein
MKLFLTLYLTLIFTQAFCQIKFPDVYCNGGKVESNQVSGYFTPLQFEFKFPGGDSSYMIREAKLIYTLNDSKDSVLFRSNKLYSDVLGVWDFINIFISKIDVFKDGKLIRTDSVPISMKIKFNHEPSLSERDAKIINNNDAILYIDGTMFDTAKPFTRQHKTFWQVAIRKKDEEDKSAAEVKKWDLLLIRGNKPILKLQTDGIGLDVKSIWKLAKRGDFIRLTIKVKGLPQKYLYKVIYIQ